jgi:hypothetical protein
MKTPIARQSAKPSAKPPAGATKSRGHRIGRPPMHLPDAGQRMAALVRRIRGKRRADTNHADILAVLNGSGRAKPISLVYFRSMISAPTTRFHRRMDPALFDVYARVLTRHYKVKHSH